MQLTLEDYRIIYEVHLLTFDIFVISTHINVTSLAYVILNFIGLQNNFWARTLYKYYIYEKNFEKYQQSILSWVPLKYEISWIKSLLEIGKFVVEHLHILLIIHKTYLVHI